MHPTFLETFKESPLFFVLSIGATGAGLMLCVVAFVLKARAPKAAVVLAALAILAGLGAVAMGLFGFKLQQKVADAAISVPGLSERDRERIRTYADEASLYSLEFGGVGLVPLIGGVLAFSAGWSRVNQQ